MTSPKPNAPPMYEPGPAYGFAPAPPFEMLPNQPTNTNVTVKVGSGAAAGSCPVCGAQSWTGTYSCFAWFLCLFCFWNCGLCCCLCMRKKKCTTCGFTVA